MIRENFEEPVTKGEFNAGMTTVLGFLLAVHLSAVLGEVIWVIVLLLLVAAMWVAVIAAWRDRPRSRAS
jgi:phosphate starvation-inducible membrane PsiE